MILVITIELEDGDGEHKHTSKIGLLPDDLKKIDLWKNVASTEMGEFLKTIEYLTSMVDST